MKRIIPLLGLFLLLAGFAVSGLDSTESGFLNLLNQYRNQNDQCYDNMSDQWQAWPGASSRTLTEASALSQASRTHNQTMIVQDCFSHQCSGEAPFDERARNAGYTGYGFLAENIAAGYESAEAAFNGWRNSAGHNQNMLSCHARAIGIARDPAQGTEYGWYWTTLFGDVIQLGAVPGPAPAPAPAPAPTPTPPSGGLSVQSYDFDQNCLIENVEFFQAVDDWIAGMVENSLFFQVVDAWISSSRVC